MSLPSSPDIYDPNTLLAISFPDDCGKYCRQGVKLAQSAARYTYEDGMHLCGFGLDIEGATRALAILDFIGQARGCHIYTGSPMLWGTQRVRGVLRCYLGALNCQDREQWCHVHQGGVLELLAGLPIRKLPCKKIVGYYAGRQLTWKECAEELQAAGVEAGVEWCPCWKMNMGSNVDLKNAFGAALGDNSEMPKFITAE